MKRVRTFLNSAAVATLLNISVAQAQEESAPPVPVLPWSFTVMASVAAPL